jgi:phosphoglycerate dehydrogenase-like enzyme
MSTTNYWNREMSTKSSFDSSSPITQEARIIVITDPNDDANERLISSTDSSLPEGATVVAFGCLPTDFHIESLKSLKPNVIYTSAFNPRETLAFLLEELKDDIAWIHSRSAGIDHVMSPTLANAGDKVVMTNAKGCYSSTLAEYTMLAISYFAKDLPRLLRNQGSKNWEKYSIEEIRGKTLGIVGYGDIGKAAARLAHAYGMDIVALKRKKSNDDALSLCNRVYISSEHEGGQKEALHRIMGESDYILCAMPLTEETRGIFDKEAFEHAKPNSVFINVGRGPIVDEDALIEALENGNRLRGAGLDVFATEPLPVDSPLWNMSNVLVSPHNMMNESVGFFVDENLPRFLRGEVLLNPVDKRAGY